MKLNDEKRVLERRITEAIESLPLFPRDIDRLLVSALKPAENKEEVLRLIEQAPELWSNLLQLAGTFYGMDGGVKTVEDAIHYVGIEPLVQLLGISYARRAIREEFDSLEYLNEYLDHSENISIGCYVLAELSDATRNHRQIYAAAGLIHDIGRLVIIVASNRTSAHVLGTLWDKMASVVHDEKITLGSDHCEVGVRLCRKWHLSEIVQEGVLRHHSPLINGDFSIPGAIIFTAHFLSASDPSGEIISTLSADEVLSNLKLTSNDFRRARELYKSRTQG